MFYKSSTISDFEWNTYKNVYVHNYIPTVQCTNCTSIKHIHINFHYANIAKSGLNLRLSDLGIQPALGYNFILQLRLVFTRRKIDR